MSKYDHGFIGTLLEKPDPPKRTPAEEARAEVEDAYRENMRTRGWGEDVIGYVIEQQRTVFDALVARLTPVFERAQRKADIDLGFVVMRDRAERAEAQSDERHDLLSAERRKNDELRRDMLRTLDERDEARRELEEMRRRVESK